ncbi:MAG: response regulator [Desulfobacterales bacterium]|nr:response regulator [Desulfobacterales bacterium]
MSKTVIIIDDSEFLIQQLKKFFINELKLNVVATGKDGNEAIALYRQFHPDLITLDITMPNKTGEDAVKEIIAEFPDAKILIISAVRGDSILDCMAYGAKGYIEKPLYFSETEFVDDFKKTIEEIWEN